MSEHGAHHGDTPASAAVMPPSLVAFAVLSLLIVFGQGACVVGSSAFGKVFPSMNSTKCALPPPGARMEQTCPQP
jgi:hypothetical protein